MWVFICALLILTNAVASKPYNYFFYCITSMDCVLFEVMGTVSNVCVFFDLGVWVFACALLIFMYPVVSMADNCFAFDFVITQFKKI